MFERTAVSTSYIREGNCKKSCLNNFCPWHGCLLSIGYAYRICGMIKNKSQILRERAPFKPIWMQYAMYTPVIRYSDGKWMQWVQLTHSQRAYLSHISNNVFFYSAIPYGSSRTFLGRVTGVDFIVINVDGFCTFSESVWLHRGRYAVVITPPQKKKQKQKVSQVVLRNILCRRSKRRPGSLVWWNHYYRQDHPSWWETRTHRWQTLQKLALTWSLRCFKQKNSIADAYKNTT